MPDLTTEVWHQAHRLMVKYGSDAAIQAAMLADAALDDGDVIQFHAWQRVVKAISNFDAALK